MEGEHDGYDLAPAMRMIVAVVVKHLLRQIFVAYKAETVNAAPCHEVETGSVPETTEQHGDDKVDVLPALAFAVAAQ